MSRQIEQERLESGDLTEDEILYLQHRGQLPANVDPVDDDLSLGPNVNRGKGPLENVVHTGDANTAGITKEEFEWVMARRQEAQENDQPTMDMNGGIVDDDEEEDYEVGWNNAQRRAELKRRNLNIMGNKEEMIARLRRADMEQLQDDDYAAEEEPLETEE